MSNEKIKRMAIRVNGMLSKTAFLFLFFIPVICVLRAVGIYTGSLEDLIFALVFILVLSVFPSVFNRLVYDEELIATVMLFSMEVLLMLVSMNRFVELSLLYTAVPVISLLYCNQKITQRACIVGYLGMTAVCVYRTSFLKDCSSVLYCNENIYLTLLKFTLEYLFIAGIVYYGAGFFESRLLEREEVTKEERLPAVYGKEGDKSGRKVSLNESVYDVQNLFSGIDRDMQSIIKGKNKKFKMELDSHLPVKLFGDKEEIRQAVSGICSDLLMYRQEASVKLYVTYDSGIVPKKKQSITLIIRISGFTDITAITVNRKALGYYLSQRIIEKLKGSFEDLSNTQEAVFRICLLQRVEDERSIENRKEQQLAELNRIQGDSAQWNRKLMFKKQVRVLVVDDNKEVCKLIDAILNSAGVLADCTDTGAKAIEMLESKDYQMVFIDQMMPEKSGIETVKELRYLEDEYYQKLPIVLMTVNTREDARKEYLEMGFSDCISKPIEGNEVKAKMRKWIKDDYPLTYAEYIKMQESENEM